MIYASGNHRRRKGRTRCRVPRLSLYERKQQQVAYCRTHGKQACETCIFFFRPEECPLFFSLKGCSVEQQSNRKEVMPYDAKRPI